MPGVRDARRRHDGVGLRVYSPAFDRVARGLIAIPRLLLPPVLVHAIVGPPVRVLLVLRRVATVRRVATDSAAGCRVRRGVGVLWNVLIRATLGYPTIRAHGGAAALIRGACLLAPCGALLVLALALVRWPHPVLAVAYLLLGSVAAVPRAIIAADMAREIAYDLADGSLARSASRMRWCLGVVAITAAPFGLGIALAAWLERSIIADLGRSLRNEPPRPRARPERRADPPRPPGLPTPSRRLWCVFAPFREPRPGAR